MATLSSIITPTNITTASNTQTLTNKTITGGILNGTLGATTPSTGAFTTVSATGQITSTTTGQFFLNNTPTTQANYMRLTNTSGNMYFGLEGATPILGGTAYDTILVGKTGLSLSGNDGGGTQLRVSSAGAAITGTLSATSTASASALYLGTNFATTGIIRLPNNNFIAGRNAANTVDGLMLGISSDDTTRLLSMSGKNILIVPGNGSTIGTFSTTGLAVTGALSATAGAAVHTFSSTGTEVIAIRKSGGYSAYLATVSSTDSGLQIKNVSGTVNMLVAEGGNVGIGTASPRGKLDVRSGVSTIVADGIWLGDNTNGWLIGENTNADLSFAITSTTTVSAVRMTLRNNGLLEAFNGLAVTGQVAATTTAGQHTFNVTQSITTGYAGVNILRAGTGQQAIRFAQATDGNEVGSITVSTTATAYNTSSDYRLKNIIGALTDSGTFIDALKPKVGTWKVDGSKFVGFLAHEFAEVSPLSVSGEKDAVDADGKPVYQSMQAGTSEVIANLVAELQSLRKRLAALEAK